MLVSHRKKFIYLKTKKTAGTSVEIYLERYCLPPDEPYVEAHHRPETITVDGVIGSRGDNPAPFGYRPHVPAWRAESTVGNVGLGQLFENRLHPQSL